MSGLLRTEPKWCKSCGSNTCCFGKYFTSVDDQKRQVWICRCCMVKGSSLYTRQLIAKGQLNASKVMRGIEARVAGIGCENPPATGCPGRPGAEILGRRVDVGESVG